MTDARVSVLCDIACHLGEGPSYDPASDTLYWFDIIEQRMLERRLADGRSRIHVLPEMASAVAFSDDGRQVLVTETGVRLRDPASGQLTTIAPIEADNALTRSNDARVHPSGSFWIGTMGKHAEHKAGAIYWFRAGAVRRLFPDVSIPNSICFSPDGAIGYFTDTAKNILFRVDCDPATGLPTGEPVLFVDRRRMEGGIDGSVVDAEGNIWNAQWGGSCVAVYSPDGREMRRISMPVRQPSCPAFIGPRADRLAVTSAWEGLDDAARRDDPEAGRTFILDTAVNGRFEPHLVL